MTSDDTNTLESFSRALRQSSEIAARRYQTLLALEFDVHHSQLGYKIRYAFDFNVLRPYLFPLLDGAFGTSQFFTSLFLNSFFFTHGFTPLLLQPYVQEMIDFLKYYQETLGQLTNESTSNATFSTLQQDLPFVRIAMSQRDGIESDSNVESNGIRERIVSRLARSIDLGWDKFHRMKEQDKFLSIQRLGLRTGIDPQYHKSREYLELKERLTEAKFRRHFQSDKFREERADDQLSPRERRRIDKDVTAMYTLLCLNRIAESEGAKEFFVLATQDTMVRVVLQEFEQSHLNALSMDYASDPDLSHGMQHGCTICRDGDYFDLYLLLYDADPTKFLTNIRSTRSRFDEFVHLTAQLDIERLRARFEGKTIPKQFIDKVERAFEDVRGQLTLFDNSVVMEDAPLMKVPGAPEAKEVRQLAQDIAADLNAVESRFEDVVSNRSVVSSVVRSSLAGLQSVMRELEITLAGHGLLFDRKRLLFYYPANLRSDLPSDFILRGEEVLSLLGEFDPKVTSQAVRQIHRLLDDYPSLVETKLLWARSYYVQGLWEYAYRLVRSLLTEQEVSDNAELLFTYSRLCKQIAPKSGQRRRYFLHEARTNCQRAHRYSGGKDPRILRELSYLEWISLIESSSRNNNASHPSDFLTGSIIRELPQSADELTVVESALENVELALQVLDDTNSRISYDVAPLRVIVMNDIAYIRCVLNLGKLFSDSSEANSVEVRKSITLTAKSEIQNALENYVKLTPKEQMTIPLPNMIDTLARILLADYDLTLKYDAPSAERDKHLQSVLAEAASLTDWCYDRFPHEECNLKLAQEITHRLAIRDKGTLTPGVAGSLTKLQLL